MKSNSNENKGKDQTLHIYPWDKLKCEIDAGKQRQIRVAMNSEFGPNNKYIRF